MRCMVTLFENETMESVTITRDKNFQFSSSDLFQIYILHINIHESTSLAMKPTGIENGQVINRFILTVVQLVLISLVLSTSARIPLLHLRELITPIGICLQEYCLLRNW